MQKDKKFLKIIACVCILAFVVALFFPVFVLDINGNSELAYSIFANYESTFTTYSLMGASFHSVWLVVNSVLIILGLMVATAYIVLFILELCNVKFKSFKLIERILSISMLVIGCLILLDGIIAILANTHTFTKSSIALIFGSGLYMQLFLIVASIFAIVAYKKFGKVKRIK